MNKYWVQCRTHSATICLQSLVTNWSSFPGFGSSPSLQRCHLLLAHMTLQIRTFSFDPSLLCRRVEVQAPHLPILCVFQCLSHQALLCLYLVLSLSLRQCSVLRMVLVMFVDLYHCFDDRFLFSVPAPVFQLPGRASVSRDAVFLLAT